MVNNIKIRAALVLGCALIAQFAFPQFRLDGQLRPRTEYRHGYGTLLADSLDAGFASSTRIRLNSGYTSESYQIYLSLQDVMVWGENRQLLPADQNNSLSIFEAWAKVNLAPGLYGKIGRQVISYDDERILGGVDWTQQARNHDAVLLQYVADSLMVDFGLAFNQDFDSPSGFQSAGTTYATTGFFSYKTMQYLYARRQWTHFTASFLLLNNGFQNFDALGNGDGISNLQTFGGHIEFISGKLKGSGNAYIQTGERQGNINVDGAYLLGLELSYGLTPGLRLGLGSELISGNKTNSPDKLEAFFPLYGTNHKFNGLMDYFYVGNHASSVGLFDLHANALWAVGKQTNLLMKLSHFRGEQQLPGGEHALGTELDFVLSRQFNGFGLQAGYSHMFAADGMYDLKGISEDNTAGSQYWAWVMLTIKPEFLDTLKK